MALTAADIESLERATLQAVPPEHLEETTGWLLPMDHGTVGRARSAVPLMHGTTDVGQLDAIVARYQARGFVPAFRLPDLPAFRECHLRLLTLGFVRHQPTCTMHGSVHAMQTASLTDTTTCDLGSRPDDAWMAMYLGVGEEPVDGACRANILARASGCLYASVRQGSRVVACGMASFGHGWLGVHGMRTALLVRGRGMASTLLNAMAQEANHRGIARVFLQVERTNIGARRLYARFGLQDAWSYDYWRPAGV